jgi:hypothetical protein
VRDLATTFLDALGLLLVAAGITGGAWPFVGAWALSFGGVVVLVGSYLTPGDPASGESP